MTNLAKLAATATEHAQKNQMTLVPTAPQRDFGPEVCIDPNRLGLPSFLDLATKIGGGVLYLDANPFNPEAGSDLGELPEDLTRHKGEVGFVRLAFAANGIVHFWERSTPWYEEAEALKDAASARLPRQGLYAHDTDSDQDDRLDEETQKRLANELAEKLLANPEFRAAKIGPRQRIGQMAIPEGTHRHVGWEALRMASERAEDMARSRYAELVTRLDELAPQLLSDATYQHASSPGARKQAAEQFLIPHGDGFPPPAYVRDELYARAQKLLKTKGATNLF
ncbi:hypothetical protein [Micromonospora sp. KC721]|uniref:hypothetical protein n=1 Tax=Micromonospora sp. KC721 TaxID=2530380 RepID=UPI0010509F04|nr:hypothetical protein [Micromonospora sp. KC721]TDB79819.1 hypothetical protein E1182_11325 [Micromonospora sp. KC721]